MLVRSVLQWCSQCGGTYGVRMWDESFQYQLKIRHFAFKHRNSINFGEVKKTLINIAP